MYTGYVFRNELSNDVRTFGEKADPILLQLGELVALLSFRKEGVDLQRAALRLGLSSQSLASDTKENSQPLLPFLLSRITRK